MEFIYSWNEKTLSSYLGMPGCALWLLDKIKTVRFMTYDFTDDDPLGAQGMFL